ncbi:transcription cofactor HES-6-like [Gastrophryne carolinensis]
MPAAAKDLSKLPGGKQERKFRKPLIERKRRERINVCLEQLKETVIRAFHLDQSKLEKADILEMTVRHLENIQRSRISGEGSQSVSQQRFSTGYIQCMHELHNLLLNCDWMDQALGIRLLNHLLKSLPKAKEATAELLRCCNEGFGRITSPTLKPDPEPLTNVLQKQRMWRPW